MTISCLWPSLLQATLSTWPTTGCMASTHSKRSSPAVYSDDSPDLATTTWDVHPETRQKSTDRGSWNNKLQFILTCLGCAVGLGNIWRFPSRAYENGGSAFLIPYLTCGIFFGLPVVYGEFFMGQYTGVASVKAFKRYAPAFQGLGWSMVIQEIFISTYYTVILTWSAVYIAYVVSGQSYQWNECNNKWNSDKCVSGMNYDACRNKNSSMPYFDPLTKACTAMANNGTFSSTREFFENYITKRSTGITDINEVNWFIALALFIMWALICASLIKGVRILGYLSYVTATLPYLIIVILFVRGVTLPGAWDGIKFFLAPDFSKLSDMRVWSAALQQLAFSLTIGCGALITMSSYNKFSNNCFRDALIVVIGDTAMSMIGGVAIFSVLGYLKLRTGKAIEDLVESGPSLSFIVYPEAMNMMPAHFIWEFFFFLMFLLLGFSTETVMVQTLATCLSDQFAFFARYRWLPVVGFCSLFFLLGLVMCTDAGWYWFLLSDEFTGSIGLTAIVALQLIVFCVVYGFPQVKRDMAKMWGEPAPMSSVRRWISRQSPLWLFSWTVICPACAIAITYVLANRDDPFVATVNQIDYTFPAWATIVGWLSTIGPLITLPIFFFYNWFRFVERGKRFVDLFRNSPSLHVRDIEMSTAYPTAVSPGSTTKSSESTT